MEPFQSIEVLQLSRPIREEVKMVNAACRDKVLQEEEMKGIIGQTHRWIAIWEEIGEI